MADVFISYSSEDFERVGPLAAALEASGLTVWWARDLQGGDRFSKVIEDEIGAAKAVLVVWTKTSVESQWVADEAALGRDAGKLLPVTLDDVVPPLGFRQIQLLDFSNWQGDPKDPVMAQLLMSLSPGAAGAGGAQAEAFQTTPTSTPQKAHSLFSRHTKKLVASLSLATIVVVAALGTALMRQDGAGTQDISLVERNFDGRGAIAVMPFINLSGDPEQEYFSDGITEDLIVTLHSYRLFPIIARTSAFTYKGLSKDVPTIASELDASYLITGSVRRFADKVRISVQLLDANGRNLWARRYDIQWTDTYSVQDEIVASIIGEIDSELVINEADLSRHARPEDMDAWDYYLKARSLTTAALGFMDINGDAVTIENNDEARRLLMKALELEPNFAAGWALLMHVEGAYSAQLGMYVTEEYRAAALERAYEYGKTAIRLNPFEAYACSCLALLLQINGQIDEALKTQEAALKELPTNAIIHAALAKILEADGQFERALKEINTAIRLSPRDIEMSTYLYFKSAIHLGNGDFEAAVTTAKEALALSPELFDAHAMKIIGLYARNDRAEALSALQDLQRTIPDFRPRGIWSGPVHQAVIEALPPAMANQLRGKAVPEGFRRIIIDLGWDEGGL